MDENTDRGRESVERICDLFRAQHNLGEVGAVEEFLTRHPDSNDWPRPLVLKLVQIEVSQQRRAGGVPQLDDYRKRFPDLDPGSLTNLFLLPPPPLRKKTTPDLPDRYFPVREIGRGGIGVVWRVLDQSLGRSLAAKVLRSRFQFDAHANARLEREALLTGALQHPGVPPIHDCGHLKNGSVFFTMKLVEGETLARILNRSVAQPLEKNREGETPATESLLVVFEQIAQTLAFAHSQQIIHRDLKPQNIMVGQFGEVQVMDWGMAKKLDEETAPDSQFTSSASNDVREQVANKDEAWEGESKVAKCVTNDSETSGSERRPTDKTLAKRSLTRMGDVFGTPGYMPPEQARGELDTLDQRADVFALGAILYELITERRLLEGLPSTQLVEHSAKADWGDAFERIESSIADDDLKRLCRDCLQTEVDHRPGDAAEVASRVRDHLASVARRLRDAEISRSKAETRTLEEKKRRRVVTWLAATIVGAILLAIGALLWYQADQRTRELANQETQVRTLTTALMTAPPSAVHFAIENLRPYQEIVVPILRASFDGAPDVEEQSTLRKKFVTSLALAEFDHFEVEFLVSMLPKIRDDEVSLAIDALMSNREAAVSMIEKDFAESKQRDRRARLATAALNLGSQKLVQAMTSEDALLDDRVGWIKSAEKWSGNVDLLIDAAADKDNSPMVRYATLAAAAMASIEDMSVGDREQHTNSLQQLYLRTEYANVRAASEAVMKRWGISMPTYETTKEPKTPQSSDSKNWYVNSIGQVMVRVPQHYWNGSVQKSSFLYVADRETSIESFRQFLKEDVAAASRVHSNKGSRLDKATYSEYFEQHIRMQLLRTRAGASESQLAVRDIGYYEALRYCNWLSRREGLQPFYVNASNLKRQRSFDMTTTETWFKNRRANGYRLPAPSEQESFIGREGVKQGELASVLSARFDEQLDYAWIVKNASEQQPVATRLPDTLGLFDVHGGVSEQSDYYLSFHPNSKNQRLTIHRFSAGGSIETQRLDNSSRGGFVRGNFGNVSITADEGFRVVRMDSESADTFGDTLLADELRRYTIFLEDPNARDDVRLDVINQLNDVGISFLQYGNRAKAMVCFDLLEAAAGRLIQKGFQSNECRVVRNGSQVNRAIALRDNRQYEASVKAAQLAIDDLLEVVQASPKVKNAEQFLNNAYTARAKSRLLMVADWLRQATARRARTSSPPGKQDTAVAGATKYLEMAKEAVNNVARASSADFSIVAELYVFQDDMVNAVIWQTKAVKAARDDRDRRARIKRLKEMEDK